MGKRAKVSAAQRWRAGSNRRAGASVGARCVGEGSFSEYWGELAANEHLRPTSPHCMGVSRCHLSGPIKWRPSGVGALRTIAELVCNSSSAAPGPGTPSHAHLLATGRSSGPPSPATAAAVLTRSMAALASSSRLVQLPLRQSHGRQQQARRQQQRQQIVAAVHGEGAGGEAWARRWQRRRRRRRSHCRRRCCFVVCHSPAKCWERHYNPSCHHKCCRHASGSGRGRPAPLPAAVDAARRAAGGRAGSCAMSGLPLFCSVVLSCVQCACHGQLYLFVLASDRGLGSQHMAVQRAWDSCMLVLLLLGPRCCWRVGSLNCPSWQGHYSSALHVPVHVTHVGGTQPPPALPPPSPPALPPSLAAAGTRRRAGCGRLCRRRPQAADAAP